MAREIQKQWTDTQTEDLLNLLVSPDTLPIQYRDAMYQLGTKLGGILNDEYQIRSKRICIACTVEDADYLAKGILDAIRLTSDAMFITVFWNQRFKPQIDGDVSLAPIIREFHDPGYQSSDVVIVLKSIIANACVVKTNLTRLLENTDPKEILIVAPVLLKGAQAKLEAEFPEDFSARFKYVYFAEDDTRSDDGIVIPGIGGNVYERLGFEGESAKNRYTPQLVKDRRSKISLQ
ncbi:MAG: hypothetical protein EOO04_01090 [Chitinophagaceae bacterium]|nr:MAG: hypothetical protein EOO04_01090 [Chitinophagaceae bacterium]